MRIAFVSLFAFAACSTPASTPTPAPAALWTSQTAPSTWLRAVWGSSPSDVYAVGGDGTILHSINHGVSWVAQPTGSQALFYSVGGSGPNDVHVVGTLGTAFHSNNGGTTWLQKKTGTLLPMHGVWAGAPGRVFVAAGDDLAGSQVLVTAGGDGWAVQAALGEASNPKPDTLEPAELMGIWGSGSDLYAVGENELSDGGSLIMHSSDGGQTWKKRTGDVGEHLLAVWGSASNDVYAVGQSGTLVHSSDRGETWKRLPSGTTVALYGIWGSGAGDVYAVGYQGTILHSADSGQSWQAQPGGRQKTLCGIWGSGPKDVYIVGEDGTILHHG